MLTAVLRQDGTTRKVADAACVPASGCAKFQDVRKTSRSPRKRSTTPAKKRPKIPQSLGRACVVRPEIFPAGLVSSVAPGAAVEVGKIGAGKFSDVVDKKLQKEFEERTNTQSKTLVLLFIRDMAMGVFPLLVLVIPWLLLSATFMPCLQDGLRTGMSLLIPMRHGQSMWNAAKPSPAADARPPKALTKPETAVVPSPTSPLTKSVAPPPHPAMTAMIALSEHGSGKTPVFQYPTEVEEGMSDNETRMRMGSNPW